MSDNSTQTTTEGLKRKMKTRVVDIRTSTDDQLVEHSAVERDGTEEGSKVSEGINARILNLLDRVEERLSQKDKVTGTIIKTHTEQIKNLTEVVVGNAKVSRRSCAVQKRGLPIATKSRGRSKKKDTKGEDTLSTKAKGKKHGAAAVNGNKSNIPPLKIDFDDDKDDDCRIEIMQQGHGTPFTYGTNMVMYMESADMPSCLDLLFRPPLGMEFVGSELAVAAYIFDEHCCGSRGVLHSLLPGEEVVDDVLNLVASMMTSSYLNEIGKRWWLPTTFAETVARPAPRMSDYYFAEPETGQQDPYSKDCGIWVAQWMMQGHVWCNYNLQVVNNVTRMRLAVDLVMGRHNAKRNEVTRMAEED
ncbi:uncharacterized protein DS421_3g76710 [Arachis hypogaea]|nr:uncharacterized protein DS421_3g76710 [Arachis hypogaea]